MTLIKTENDSLLLNKITKRYQKKRIKYLEGVCENADGFLFRLTWKDKGKETDWNAPIEIKKYRTKKKEG